MAKRELSPLQKAYSEFFFDMLAAYEVDTPAQLSDEKKKEFFNQIKTDWVKKKKELAKQGIKPKVNEEKAVIKAVLTEVKKITEAHKLLNQSFLSSSEYQKAKKLKGFDAKNYKWDTSKDLYKKLNEEEEKVRAMIRGILNEENEIFKAQDSIKGVMFKIKKLWETLFAKWKKDGYLESYKLKMEPWNTGYQIRRDYKESRNMWDAASENEAGKKIAYALFTNGSIFLQPASFFQSEIDEGDKTYIEGKVFQIKKEVEYPRYDVKSKADIKKATDQFYKANEKYFKEAMKWKI